MQELFYVKPGRLEWRDTPEPKLQSEADALVRPFIAGRCDGDIFFLRGAGSSLLRLGASMHMVDPALADPRTNFFRGPFPYGHEAVAEVLQVGPSVRRIRTGDVVIVPWSISCGTCARCRAGLTSHCATHGEPITAYGFGQPLGGHGGMVSDVVRVPHADHMLHLVPEDIAPLAVACASDNLADAYRTVAPHLQRTPGAPVLILGGAAKSIGLYAAGIAAALGSEQVDYVDTSRSRLETAAHLGATPHQRGRRSRWFERSALLRADGYPIVVDATSTGDGLRYALRSLAPGGICTGVGFYFRRGTPLPLWPMYLRSATLHVGVSHPGRDLPALLGLVAERILRPEILRPEQASWDEAPRALLEPATKLVLTRSRMAAA